MMKKLFRIMWKTMKWGFIVFCVYLCALFFIQQKIPPHLVEQTLNDWTPTNLVFHVDYVSFGFRHGLLVRNLRLYNTERENPLELVAGAESLEVHPFQREVIIGGAKYPRLPDGYYKEGNHERNSPLKITFPDIGEFKLVLNNPNILAIQPQRVIADVRITPKKAELSRADLLWTDNDRNLRVAGECVMDLEEQRLVGNVKGFARQAYMRKFIDVLDVPVVNPYYDGFTKVIDPVEAKCDFKVNLINNDFDMDLEIEAKHGRYNGIAFKSANGKIQLCNRIRGDSLNYNQTIGPIEVIDVDGCKLSGKISVSGENGYNTVDVRAESNMPLADILKVANFKSNYIDRNTRGDSKCSLQFRFPRAMTNNYEVLNGKGKVTIAGGQVMRFRGFAGLLSLLAEKVPGFSLITDTTHADSEFKIENGILTTNDTYIEGSFFLIMLDGEFDLIKQALDFTARVQFMKNESMVGKVINPIIWPFAKLLLEFKLTGSPDNTEWDYLSVVDRIFGI